MTNWHVLQSVLKGLGANPNGKRVARVTLLRPDGVQQSFDGVLVSGGGGGWGGEGTLHPCSLMGGGGEKAVKGRVPCIPAALGGIMGGGGGERRGALHPWYTWRHMLLHLRFYSIVFLFPDSYL